MRKRIVLGLALAVITVGALGVVGSAAWFTDQSTVPFTATGGALDIRAEVGMEDADPTDRAWYDPTGVTLNLTNVMPGVYGNPHMINIQNLPSGFTSPAQYQYTAEKIASDPGFWASLYVKAETGFCETNATQFTLNPQKTVYEGPLSSLQFDNGDYFTGTGILPVNITHCYRFSFKLADDAGNQLQGGSATFNVVIDAIQEAAPAPW